MVEGLNIRIVTWNINALRTVPPLDDLIKPNSVGQPDIIAFGLQELSSDLLEASYFDDATGVLRQDWARKIQHHIGDEYMRAVVNRCGWAGLIVFLRKEVRPLLKRADTQQVTLGFNNLLGNKSGIATRFELINGQSFTLVTAHLAAHQDKVYKRNEDYRRCSHYLTFGRSGRESVHSQSNVIWFGDLNYRLEASYAMVKRCLTETEIASQTSLNKLLATDQLNDVRKRSLAFGGYTEAEITFTPTYKFMPGSDTYSGDRVPAWTDRVLYKGKNIRQLSYRRHARYKQSDHKPVSADLVFMLNPDVQAKTLSAAEMPSMTRVAVEQGSPGGGEGRRRYTDDTHSTTPIGASIGIPTGDLLHIGAEEVPRCHSYPNSFPSETRGSTNGGSHQNESRSPKTLSDTKMDRLTAMVAAAGLTVGTVDPIEGNSPILPLRDNRTPPPRPPAPYQVQCRTSYEERRLRAESNASAISQTGDQGGDSGKADYYRGVRDNASPVHGPYSGRNSLDDRPGGNEGQLVSITSNDNISRAIGGSGDETTLARDTQGLSVGSSDDLIVLGRPDTPEELLEFDPLYSNLQHSNKK